MKTTIFTRLIAASIVSATLLTACSKNNTVDELNNGPTTTTSSNLSARASGPAMISTSILNQKLSITYARDGATDITEQMNEWRLKFVGDYPGGEAQAWNDILARSGTWAMAEGSSTITLSYPPDLPQLIFLSKTWTVNSEINRGPEIIFTAADGSEIHMISEIQ